jgi:fructose-1,6-bisphosphatase II
MDRNLALELARVTEAAALACARWMGKGDKHAADQAAVDAMRRAFNDVYIDGTVVIGEGERDEAPMLYIGEKVGKGGLKVDIALDPLECTNSVAYGRPNALSVIAIGPPGSLLHAPDTYMDKIAVGPRAAPAIDLSRSVEENLHRIAEALDYQLEDVTCVILDRDRHKELVERVRKLGCRIHFIPDGDVGGAIATAMPDSGIDVLLGVGAAPEGVLAASALRCVGGSIQGRLQFRNQEEKDRARAMGIQDLDRIYTEKDLASGDNIMFAATGVSDGDLLRGIRFTGHGAISHSLVMRSRTGTVRKLETQHRFEGTPVY